VNRLVALALFAALGLAPAACGVPSGQVPGAAVTTPGTPGTAAASAGTPGSPAGPGTAVATAGPSPTTDPAVIALIQSFKLPAKGSEDALVTVYEFSDYL